MLSAVQPVNGTRRAHGMPRDSAHGHRLWALGLFGRWCSRNKRPHAFIWLRLEADEMRGSWSGWRVRLGLRGGGLPEAQDPRPKTQGLQA